MGTRVKRDRSGTPTERALARMLMEPTGRHFLDSGGAYGRAWERNQASRRWRARDWLATPELWVDAFAPDTDADGVETTNSAGPVLSVFHYLRQRLEFDSQLTAWLIREGNRTDDPWLVSMEAWAAERHEGDPDSYWRLDTFNSYNTENLLSQTIQGTTFTYRDEPYVALQIHGGADVRGGYTAPKVFAVTTDEAYSLFDWDTWSFGHELEHSDTQDAIPGMPALPTPEQHTWESERGSSDGWIDSGGSYVRMSDYADHGHLDGGKGLVWERRDGGTWVPRCPIDGAPCEVWAPQAW
jgi:hypothetical protein